ncbi:DUF1850 domain-containing protein [Pseudoroseicyclus tamaricis]|uniref:DUF1850 domain-containing protein n=1 Tax=Pseudoroseicyclus tamaricis TaxID=2705421 RepID=A0A6B2JSX0_9RHOB|nr:DUF1850 domain-containing protein [Pseudoroseicyclus tamaricis]NDV01110.1 DUF1850 domain-containing protein [Pseudoroseicyclus tamaricis]
MTCLAVGAALLALADPVITLSWTHSVEQTEWVETWEVGPERLTLLHSALKGSGAGMEPGPEAELEDGWWVSPGGLEVPELLLAASGATASPWTLCADGTCREIGGAAGPPLALAPCSGRE